MPIPLSFVGTVSLRTSHVSTLASRTPRPVSFCFYLRVVCGMEDDEIPTQTTLTSFTQTGQRLWDRDNFTLSLVPVPLHCRSCVRDQSRTKPVDKTTH